MGGAMRALCPPTQSTPKAEGTRRRPGWPRQPSHMTNRPGRPMRNVEPPDSEQQGWDTLSSDLTHDLQPLPGTSVSPSF